VFFSLSFIGRGLPLVAHSHWRQVRGATHDCHLYICSSQEQLLELLRSDKVTEGRKELEGFVGDLPETPHEPMVHVEGDVASTLAALVVALENRGAEIRTLSKSSEVSGFWEPPREMPLGSGIIIWADAETAYHVAIVHSKDQALSVVRSLADWMGRVQRGSLHARINGWNISEKSEEPILRIEGKAAELLHWGSLLGRLLSRIG
jgi:hypothetical protein